MAPHHFAIRREGWFVQRAFLVGQACGGKGRRIVGSALELGGPATRSAQSHYSCSGSDDAVPRRRRQWRARSGPFPAPTLAAILFSFPVANKRDPNVPGIWRPGRKDRGPQRRLCGPLP